VKLTNRAVVEGEGCNEVMLVMKLWSCLVVYSLICLSVYLFICLSVYLFICLSVDEVQVARCTLAPDSCASVESVRWWKVKE